MCSTLTSAARAGLPAKIVAFARGEVAQTRFRFFFESK